MALSLGDKINVSQKRVFAPPPSEPPSTPVEIPDA